MFSDYLKFNFISNNDVYEKETVIMELL